MKVDKLRYPSEKAWQRIGTERCRSPRSRPTAQLALELGWKVGADARL